MHDARRRPSMLALLTGGVVLLTAAQYSTARAQPQGDSELAARMTGIWKLNIELSPSLATPGRGRVGARRSPPAFGVIAAALQRGGRGGRSGGGELSPEVMPEEAAAQAALSTLQQVPVEFRIEASAAEVRFAEPRGESTFKVDGRNATVAVPGGAIKVKSRWDRGALRQEFSSTQRKLVKVWTVGGDDRLVLLQHVESLTFNSKDSKAVFDRR